MARDDITPNVRLWNLGIGTAGQFRFAVFVGGVQKNAESATGFAVGVPKKLIGTCDGTNVVMYVDGVRTASIASGGNVDTGSSDLTFLGRASNTGGTAWNGDVYAGYIWNYALPEKLIRLLFENPYGIFMPPSPRIRYFFIPAVVTPVTVADESFTFSMS